MSRDDAWKNHLVELPLTFERMRSPVRSLSRAIFFIVGEERMARR